MTTLTVTAKGQVTFKKELLEHLGVRPGQQIQADKLPDGRVVVRAAERDGNISDFIGSLSHKKRPKLTIEQINEIARQGWAGKR